MITLLFVKYYPNDFRGKNYLTLRITKYKTPISYGCLLCCWFNNNLFIKNVQFKQLQYDEFTSSNENASSNM